ncbi:unnamed protein product [Clonostachys chloroleuca]|uniref:CCHC-type domain-containing protein n=1 Tax=Clonostachys chloroleuca TaxID=1926264 RepID=A0AA35QAG6_9HYPO|nr:unnamed protein product [Clonostachys chloroleuca]
MARDILADLAASLRRANGRDNQTRKFVADLAAVAARLRQATGASAPPGGRNRHHRPRCWNCKKLGHVRAECRAPPRGGADAEGALPAAESSQ